MSHADPVSLAVPHAPALLAPSDALRRQLFLGVIAALVAGGLAIAGVLTEPPPAQAQGITPAHLFESASTLAQLVVLWAYIGLAREAGSHGLKKSSQCLIGLLLVGELYVLAVTHVLTPGWQKALGAAVAAGIAALVAAVAWPWFATGETPAEPAPDAPPEAPTETAQRSTAAKVLAGATVAAFFVLKAAAKFLGKKAVKGMAKWEAESLEAFAGGVLVLLGLGLVTWFAASKVRLRARLGAFAAVVGWAEILILVAFLGSLAWLVASAFAAVGPNMGDKEIDAVFEARFLQLQGPTVALVALWTALTVALFGTVRARRSEPRA